MRCAVVEPTNPPPTTVTFFRMSAFSCMVEDKLKCNFAYRLPAVLTLTWLPVLCMFSMMAVANSEVFSFVAPSIRRSRSYVTRFWPMVRSIPVSIRRPTSCHPMKSNIITPESMTELGLMTSLSAYFGAVPCVASKQP